MLNNFMNAQKNFFSWHELTATNTGLFNNPTAPVHLVNLANLWKYLNFLREKLAAPIYVNSAYRTPAVNKLVGGSECSFHMVGRAADIRTLPNKMVSLRELLLSHLDPSSPNAIIEFIDHETFFHISI